MFMNASVAFIVLVAFGYISGLVPVIAIPYLKVVPRLLIPVAVAFALSYGMWLATPPLIVWMLIKSATAFFATAAGPIGIVNIGHQMVHNAPSAWAVAVSMVMLFVLINSAIAGFNLVPLAQLDGGKIMEMVLEKIFGRHAPVVIKWYRIVSLVLILSLAAWLILADGYKLFTGAVLVPKH
jgi:Zn-dependent protease